jgi:hypothetical protein
MEFGFDHCVPFAASLSMVHPFSSLVLFIWVDENNANWQRSHNEVDDNKHLLAAFLSLKYDISLSLCCCIKDFYVQSFAVFCVNGEADG